MKRATRRTKAQWQEIVSRFAASGLSMDAFCAEHGLNHHSLIKWKGRLSPCAQPKQPPNALIELKPAMKPDRVRQSSGSMSCYLPNGNRLEWDTNISPTYIAALLGALQ